MTEIVNKTYWIVSVPVNSNREEPYQELNRVTISNGEAAEVHKLELPELRVGTLDSLISLSDELTKYDLFVESVVKKIGTCTHTLTNKLRFFTIMKASGVGFGSEVQILTSHTRALVVCVYEWFFRVFLLYIFQTVIGFV